MDKLDLWFPTAIYTSTNLLDDKSYTKSLIDRCYNIQDQYSDSKTELLASTYNTMNNHNILTDVMFQQLIHKVTNKVHNFLGHFNSTLTLEMNSGWINIYKQNNYQEFHIHSGSIISCVYLLQCPKGSAGLSFAPQVRSAINLEPNKKNNLSYDYASYDAMEDSLVIFKSDIPHMVAQGSNTEDRISIAFNFKEKHNDRDT